MEKRFKPWKCGDPYVHDFESRAEDDDSDPWKGVLDAISVTERIRSDAWKEEVQNLLVFAGLFSAVTTAFLAESYKSLRPDSAADTVAILRRISEQLDSSADGSSNVPTNSFEAAQSDVRVNTFWFLSLIFSLSSALLGIILLQWLREHQRPTLSTTRPRISVAMLQMNDEALDVYFVHQIFTSLPVLLIFGLTFFFIGMIDFLWHINRTVAGPSFAAIAIILTFLLLTTIIPGLQPLPGYATKKKGRPGVQCPYRSPQAWAFLKLTGFIRRTFKRLAGGKSGPFASLFSEDLKATWSGHSISWLRQRDRALQPPTDLAIPLYDAVRALVKIKETAALDRSRRDIMRPTIYNAFQNLTESLCGRSAHRSSREVVALLLHLQEMLLDMVPQQCSAVYALPTAFILERDDEPKRMCDVLLDNVRLLFIHLTPEKDPRLKALTTTRCHVEICVRLTNYVFSGTPIAMSESCNAILLPPTMLIADFLRHSSVPRTAVRKEVSKQLLPILEELFLQTADTPDIEKATTHASHYLTQFLRSAAEILGDGSNDRIRTDHESLFDSIAERLAQRSIGSDYIFSLASIYSQALSNGPFLESSKALTSLLLMLQEYERKLDGESLEGVRKIQQMLHGHEDNACTPMDQFLCEDGEMISINGKEPQAGVLATRAKEAVDMDHAIIDVGTKESA